MKSSSIVLLAALLAITFSTAGAASKNRKTIELTEPIAVGSVILEPGYYTIERNGAGPQVQVTFSQRKAIMAIVPATLEVAKNPCDSVTTRVGARWLIEIDMKIVDAALYVFNCRQRAIMSLRLRPERT